MAFDIAKEHLRRAGLEDQIYEFEVSSTTVELTAQIVGCEPAHIAKTLSFVVNQKTVLVMAAGDAKVDNHKYKGQFHTKAKMLSPDKVTELVDHSVGGVYPFGVKEGIAVYLSESLKWFDVVYPAHGGASSAVELTIPELGTVSGYLGWIDVCRGWEEDSIQLQFDWKADSGYLESAFSFISSMIYQEILPAVDFLSLYIIKNPVL